MNEEIKSSNQHGMSKLPPVRYLCGASTILNLSFPSLPKHKTKHQGKKRCYDIETKRKLPARPSNTDSFPFSSIFRGHECIDVRE